MRDSSAVGRRLEIDHEVGDRCLHREVRVDLRDRDRVRRRPASATRTARPSRAGSRPRRLSSKQLAAGRARATGRMRVEQERRVASRTRSGRCRDRSVRGRDWPRAVRAASRARSRSARRVASEVLPTPIGPSMTRCLTLSSMNEAGRSGKRWTRTRSGLDAVRSAGPRVFSTSSVSALAVAGDGDGAGESRSSGISTNARSAMRGCGTVRSGVLRMPSP